MKRAWIALAFALWPVAQAQESNGATDKAPAVTEQTQHKAGQHQYPTVDTPFPVLITKSKEEQRRDAERENKADENQDKYIGTQTSIADAAIQQVRVTRAAVCVALLDTVVAALALWFLFLTWRENIKIAKATRASVEANRAWMLPGSHSFITQKGQDVTGEELWLFTPYWKNNGRTPALGVLIHTDERYIGADEQLPDFTPEKELKWPKTAGAVIAQDSETNGKQIIVNGQNLVGLLTGTHSLVVFSAIKYADVYGPTTPRYSEVCRKISVMGMERVHETGVTNPRWKFETVGLRNTAR